MGQLILHYHLLHDQSLTLNAEILELRRLDVKHEFEIKNLSETNDRLLLERKILRSEKAIYEDEVLKSRRLSWIAISVSIVGILGAAFGLGCVLI